MKQINKSKQYSALTIDTSIFNQHGLKLEKGLLAKLVQFKEMPINFVLSDVVYREVMNHLNKKEKEVRDKIKASLTDVSDYFGCKELALEEVISLLNIDYDGNDKGSKVIPPKRAASKSRINTSPAFSAGRVSLLKPSYAFALE